MSSIKPVSLAAWSTEIARSSPVTVKTTRVSELGRREWVSLVAAVGGGLALGLSRFARASTCSTGARNPIQGPYYLGDPEQRDDTGSGIGITGRVLDDQTCAPIVGATIVRWHANDLGFYEEFYRAQMTTKTDGAFSMSTIPPGQYAGLPRHIHWYVVAPGYVPLTAQIQWGDDETIAGDRTWDFSLTKGT